MNIPQRNTDNPLDILIEGWGQMGACWGVGKVMAEIHALLYLSPQPLNLEEMSERLKTSRSNISVNVRALQDLGVVRKVIIPGDRRDYYSAEQDVAKVARKLAAKKKKRELDPALRIVDEAIRAAESLASSGSSDVRVDTRKLYRLKHLMQAIKEIFEAFLEDEPLVVEPGETVNAPNL